MRRAPIGVHVSAIVGVCLVSLAVIIGYSTSSAFQRERARATAQVGSTAEFAATGLASQFGTLPTFLSAIAAEPAVSSFDPTACDAALASYAHFGLGFVSLVEPDGTVVCTSEPRVTGLARPYYPSQPWFARALGGASLDGTVTADPLSGKPRFVEATGVAGPLGLRGELVALLDPGFLSLGAARPLDASGIELLVLDPGRHAIISASGPDRRLVGRSLVGTRLARRVNGSAAAGPDGVDRIYDEATVVGPGWHVVAGLPTATALAGARSELWRNLGLGALMMLVVVALGLVLRRRVVRPVRSLTVAMERAGRGEGTTVAPEEGPAELATMARAFNTMLREREAFENFLAHQASHDTLTGLPNRRSILERLNEELETRRNGAACPTVGFLDLDRFKLINDSHGHSVGDQILASLAARIQGVLADGETAGRFGGDEFVVVSTNAAAEPAEFATRIASVLATPLEYDGHEVFLSGSIGIALAGSRTRAEDLLAEADAAMYRAKETRQSFAVFDTEMRASAASRLSIEAGLHRAVEKDELVLLYQPVVRLSDGALDGVEALLRWHRPGQGLIPPDEFIPVAEQTGLIVPIGAWVLEEACRQGTAWRDTMQGAHPQVSINVSTRQLAQPGFSEQVAAALDRTDFYPGDLCLEITESVLIDDVGSTRQALMDLRELGVGVAVDDFGTGYSSLVYLQQYPVDQLKVDRTFVARLARDIHRGAIVRSVVDLAHSLHIEVVAEGIETLDQLVALRRMGCDAGQGYYFSAPLPADELEAHVLSGGVWDLQLTSTG